MGGRALKDVAVTPSSDEPVTLAPVCECVELADGGRMLCETCKSLTRIREQLRNDHAIRVDDDDGEI